MAVITVSREYGRRGEEIAQQAANELGYSYFDKEILTDVAREVNTTEDKISEHDEKDAHGFRALLLHDCEMRAAKYQTFLQQWEALEEADFKNQLLKIVSSRKN